MKRLKCVLTILFTLCLFLCLTAPGFAETGSDEDEEADEGIDFANLSWEELVASLLAIYNGNPESVSFGYYNTVTGEEHYHNPDKFFVGASTYKVPLNMYFIDMIEDGSFTWDSTVNGVPYEMAMKYSITWSDNNMASYLYDYIGGYYKFRELILPYMEPDPENVDPVYDQDNNFTAREMVYCFKQLYSEPRYEKIIEAMRDATPGAYFAQDEDRYAIAQKYGFLVQNYRFYLNDAAIVYTHDPIILVMFSSNLSSVYQIMSQYCTLMCDYTQYHATERIKAHSTAEALREPWQLSELFAPDLAAKSPTNKEDSAMDMSSTLLYIVVAAVAAAAIVLVLIRSKRREGAKPLGLIIAIAVSALALCVCVTAVSAGTLVAKPSGDPRDTVELFFNALEAQDYISTYSCLSNYDSLGLENTPDTEVGKLAYQALRDSYSYEFSGECSVTKLDAVQPISFTYLDLTAIEGDVESEVKLVLNSIVQSRPRSELYDENNKYLPAVTDEAYKTAVTNVLRDAEKYYVTVPLDVTLTYKNNKWFIVMDEPLLKAVIGNTLH